MVYTATVYSTEYHLLHVASGFSGLQIRSTVDGAKVKGKDVADLTIFQWLGICTDHFK
jgi:hypothetical protein